MSISLELRNRLLDEYRDSLDYHKRRLAENLAMRDSDFYRQSAAAAELIDDLIAAHEQWIVDCRVAIRDITLGKRVF